MLNRPLDDSFIEVGRDLLPWRVAALVSNRIAAACGKSTECAKAEIPFLLCLCDAFRPERRICNALRAVILPVGLRLPPAGEFGYLAQQRRLLIPLATTYAES